jgi:hypothetical protein
MDGQAPATGEIGVVEDRFFTIREPNRRSVALDKGNPGMASMTSGG